MIEVTLRNVISGDAFLQEQSIYMIANGDDIFYIGRSTDPYDRLLQHMGGSLDYPCYTDWLGRVIEDNLPASLDWTMTIWTVKELLSPEYYEKYERCFMLQSITGDIETKFIQEYKPYLNIMGRNYHNPLPKKYDKSPEIANEGIKFNR